jgi:hypothetical protein
MKEKLKEGGVDPETYESVKAVTNTWDSEADYYKDRGLNEDGTAKADNNNEEQEVIQPISDDL